MSSISHSQGKKLVAELAGKRNEKEALFVERSPKVRLVAVTVDSLNLRYAGEESLLAKVLAFFEFQTKALL